MVFAFYIHFYMPYIAWEKLENWLYSEYMAFLVSGEFGDRYIHKQVLVKCRLMYEDVMSKKKRNLGLYVRL